MKQTITIDHIGIASTSLDEGSRFWRLIGLTAKGEDDFKKIKKLLIDQIFSTVKWRESLNYMSENGIKNYIEIGPGKALSGMVKRTIKNDFNCFSVNSIDDMKKIENEIKK